MFQIELSVAQHKHEDHNLETASLYLPRPLHLSRTPPSHSHVVFARGGPLLAGDTVGM